LGGGKGREHVFSYILFFLQRVVDNAEGALWIFETWDNDWDEDDDDEEGVDEDLEACAHRKKKSVRTSIL